MEDKGLTDVVRELYVFLDKEAERRAGLAKVSCKRGCFHCCMLMATASIVEGIYVADHLLRQDIWKGWLPRLREAALAYCYKGINKANYFDKKIPCVFLKDGECSIYEYRPEACRYHYVVSPPENCAPDAKNTNTAILNLLPLSEQVWLLNSAFVKQLMDEGRRDAFKLVVGPIPIVVLCGMGILLEGEPQELVLKAMEGLPAPMDWVINYTDDSELEGNLLTARQMSDDEVKKLWE